MSEKLRILVVHDRGPVRELLADTIQQDSDLLFYDFAESSADALSAIATNRPDIVIVGFSSSDETVGLIGSVNAIDRDLPVVVLSMSDEVTSAERAIRAGARGYINDAEPRNEIVTGIRNVLSGKLHLSAAVEKTFAQMFLSSRVTNSRARSELSDRELQVLTLLGEGLDTAQIGETLNLKPNTVQAHYVRIRSKLKLTSFAQLLKEAMRRHG